MLSDIIQDDDLFYIIFTIQNICTETCLFGYNIADNFLLGITTVICIAMPNKIRKSCIEFTLLHM